MDLVYVHSIKNKGVFFFFFFFFTPNWFLHKLYLIKTNIIGITGAKYLSNSSYSCFKLVFAGA